MCLPFVEGRGTFMSQHGESAAHGTAVLAGRGVHEARFDDVHRGRHHGCAEARAEGSGKVARQIIWAENRKPAELASFSCVFSSNS